MINDWQPTTSGRMRHLRAELLHTIRRFFRQREVLEVETPILSAAANPDPNIHSFVTTGEQPRYLRTSPEFPLKRLLAAASGDCYEMGRVFRETEAGAWHNPEFTMLEWYRVGWSWQQLAEEVVALVRECGATLKADIVAPVHSCSYRQLFLKYTGLDPLVEKPEVFAALLDTRSQPYPEDMEYSQWLDYIFSVLIQPRLPTGQLTVVHHFPARQAALAELDPADPELALRFEIYLGSSELANGYQELRDAETLRQRFKEENRLRLNRGLAELPVDNLLLAAQQQDLPACSGVALGVDRLLMVLTGSQRIEDVINFPYARA